MMQEKIDSLCEMAKKLGCSDKTVEMMKGDLSKAMGGGPMGEPKMDEAKVEIEATAKDPMQAKDAIKKALELLSNELGNRM